MKCNCAVTFEYTLRNSDVWRGVIEGAAPHTIVHRATAAAMKAIQPRSWASIAVVIIDRDDQTPSEAE